MSHRDPRLKRLERLAALIQRRLDQEVASLSRARSAHAEAVRHVQALRTQLDQAVRTALDSLAPGAEAEQWRVVYSWHESLRVSLDAACQQEALRQGEVDAARTRVLIARDDLNRMSALISRVVASNRITASRKERRAEDDVYAALAAPSRGSAGEAH